MNHIDLAGVGILGSLADLAGDGEVDYLESFGRRIYSTS